jgi:hypothetical protein
VAGRTGVALPQSKTANETVTCFIVTKLQAHPMGIIGTASEAMISLKLDVTRVVPDSMTFVWHCSDFTVKESTTKCDQFCGCRIGVHLLRM